MQIEKVNYCPNTNQNLIADSQTHSFRGAALLTLFQPKPIQDIVQRPLQYNFGDAFINTLIDVGNRGMNYNNGVDARSYYLHQNPEAAASILPTAQGTVVETSRFSNNWTFMLTVDLHGITGAVTRVIYSGVCDYMDVSLSGRPDPNGILRFTRMSKVDQSLRNGRLMGNADIEVVDTSSQQALTRGEVRDLNPASLADTSFSLNTDGSMDMYRTTAHNNRMTTSIINDNELNDPAGHVNTLASAITAAASVASADQYDYSFNFNSPANTTLNQVRATLTSMRHCHDTQTDGGEIIRLLTPYTLGELDTLFSGQLNVQVVGYLSESNVSVELPNAPTARNVFSSVITGAIQEALIKFGLVSVSFSYITDTGEGYQIGIMRQAQSGVALNHIAPVMQIDAASIDRAWQNLYTYLENFIFPIVKQASGGRDFRIDLNATITGTTYIRFNFLDDLYCPDFVAIESTLGGINSSLLGSEDLYRRNAASLASAVADACDGFGLTYNENDFTY